MIKKLTKNSRGSVLIALLVVIPSLMLIVAFYIQLSVNSFRIARKDQFRTHAQFAADAGADLAIKELNDNDTWTGTATPQTLHDDGTVKTTYEVVVTANNSDSKTITTTGKTYSPVNSSEPRSTVNINVDVRAVPTGDFSVVTGVGGLKLSNTAKIVGGDVFVNGTIHLQNSAQIGLTTNSLDVKVAHQSCPNPATSSYPLICNSGENGEPITIENTAHIYGSVTANNQTSGSSMSNPGLVGSSGVETEPLPTHDRNAQKNAVAINKTGAEASCTSQNGTLTWDANTKITGNVDITNNCKVTVSGNVWITGKLEMKNSSELIVANSLGTTRPDIMIDGLGTKFSNTSTIVSNTSTTGVRFITYWSNSSCSPDCADVTGVDLFNSQNQLTIELDNSAEGPQTIFYARWSRVMVTNSGQLGALVGQTVELKNSGTITFGTSTNTGKVFWVTSGYRRSR